MLRGVEPLKGKDVVGRDVFEKERALWEGMSLKGIDVAGRGAFKKKACCRVAMSFS